MTQSNDQDDQPLDPAQEAIVRRLRRLMVFSSLIMIAGFVVVFGVIGYRLLTAPQQDSAIEANVSLPVGARVVSTAVSDGQLVVTLDIGGAVEVRTFDLSTLKQTGRMTFLPR
jgi:cytochrome c biogenesis protein CcdA